MKDVNNNESKNKNKNKNIIHCKVKIKIDSIFRNLFIAGHCQDWLVTH